MHLKEKLGERNQVERIDRGLVESIIIANIQAPNYTGLVSILALRRPIPSNPSKLSTLG